MARKSTHTFVQSKMNKDLDARLLEAGQYRDAKNVAVSRSDSDDVGALENVLGNILLKSLPKGEKSRLAEAIGWCFNEDKDQLYVFITNYKGKKKAPITSYHSIVQYNIKDDSLLVLVQGSFLNFSIGDRINDAEMIEDLLFFTDNRNQPRKINVTLANPNNLPVPNYYDSEDTISVAKYYPHEAIKLTDTVEIEAIYIDKTEVPTGASEAPYQHALYNYFVLPDNPSQDIIDLLFMNIGLDGYIEAGQGGGAIASYGIGKFTFKLAFFQEDGYSPEGYFISGQERLPGNYAGKYILFVDRDFSDGQVIAKTSWSDTGSSVKKIKINFKVPNAIDVSDPWRKEDQFKVAVDSISFNSFLYCTSIAASTSPPKFQAHNSFLFGTRSSGQDYNTVPASSLPAGIEPFCNGPFFRIDNFFPRNTFLAKLGYIRVKNPKIPPEVIIVVKETNCIYNSATSRWEFRISVGRLAGTESTSSVPNANLGTEYGVTSGDIMSFHWPNPYYDGDFSGDPTFTEDKFIRFSYRFKFDDGEYSVIAPFTQSVFIPKQDGYFLKEVNKTPQDLVKQELIPQIQTAGQNTVVEWFENKVTQVKLKIPLGEFTQSELAEKLHVSEIDILYKESDQQVVKVLKNLELAKQDNLVNENFFNYTYKSEEPIKVLESSEIGRVYDNVPVKAKTQAVTGNRIVYANFLDKHTSPLFADYNVGVSAKYDANFDDSSDAYYCYPNHTLKQNRTYQVGIILSDRYGRSSDVILARENIPSFVKNTRTAEGDWSNSPINFNNSTVYNPYFNSVTSLFTNQGLNGTTQNPSLNPRQTASPKSGIIDWRGDSLKLGFLNNTTVIPEQLYENASTIVIERPGYPGLYKSLITNPAIDIFASEAYTGTFAEIQDEGFNLYEISFVSSGSGFNGDVGNYIEYNYFNNTGSYEGEAIIMTLERNVNGSIGVFRAIIATKKPFPVNNGSSTGGAFDELVPSMDSQGVFNENKTLGWYSYRVVVKQKEQDYYNVYLPSLLKGSPVPKPFKLFLEQPEQATTKVLTVDNTKHPIPQTFPILEGMTLQLNTVKVFVSNILNDTQFEITEPVANSQINAPAGSPPSNTEYEFSMPSNGSTLNTTTLLTDNANKVPPSLVETTPVQAQYGTSETRLIPRVALPGNAVNAGSGIPNLFLLAKKYSYENVPPEAYGSFTFPVYPERGQNLTIRSLGNFESLFIDGKYNGLWQANTNPPSSIIENTFNIGREAETAKPINEEMYQEAVFETTPTISNLEIFYESSTSGLVYDLNRAGVFGRTIEVDFYNSFWTKRIKTVQPSKQLKGVSGLNNDFSTNPEFGNRGAGSSPSLGVFPLSNVYAPPVTTPDVLEVQEGVDINAWASNSDYNFYLEESRLRGGFNNTETGLGARAFLDQDDPTQQHRFNALIYSGVYNSRTGINRTNEFPTGQVLTRAANPENGSIQKIYSEEGNLLVLQENKCNRALIDKDTIYTAEGGTQTQAGGTVIGQITPYAGQYGISKNPESFGMYGFRKYFADVNRGCMLRLSHDGVTEISEYGMRDWFRDNLANITQNETREFKIFCSAAPSETTSLQQTYYELQFAGSPDIQFNLLVGSEVAVINSQGEEQKLPNTTVIGYDANVPNPKVYLDGYAFFPNQPQADTEVIFIQKNRSYIIGGWDIYNKQYVCSLQYNYDSTLKRDNAGVVQGGKDMSYHTLSFDEPTLGWPSFYNYRPGLIGSMKNKYYTINNSAGYTLTGVGEFGLYNQFAQNQTGNNRGFFYGNFYPSSVTIIANQFPSTQKTFLAIDYEGNNGWQANIIFSDETGADVDPLTTDWSFYEDKSQLIKSYTDGSYTDAVTGYTLKAGFDRKDNRYVANIVNVSDPMPGEIIFGNKMTGIKGYYAIATLSTEGNTDIGGMKELYQVGLSYNVTAK